MTRQYFRNDIKPSLRAIRNLTPSQDARAKFNNIALAYKEFRDDIKQHPVLMKVVGVVLVVAGWMFVAELAK